MRTYKPMLVGPAPTAFSTGHDECGRTHLSLQTDTVTLTGDIECRRKAARALAEAVGLVVAHPDDVPYPTGTLAGLEHLIAAAT